MTSALELDESFLDNKDFDTNTNNSLMMDLPTPVRTLDPFASARRSILDLTEEEKNKIIEDCTLKLISPQVK